MTTKRTVCCKCAGHSFVGDLLLSVESERTCCFGVLMSVIQLPTSLRTIIQ